MTDVAAALMIVGAVVLSVRWWGRRADGMGRPRPFPTTSVVALVLLALVAAVPGVRRRSEEARLSFAASVLAGLPVRVHCQTFGQAFVDAGGELGYVKWQEDGAPERATLIKREQCGALRTYLGSAGARADPTFDEVVAVHVLTHESMHMRGEKAEAKAECEAVQRDAQTAQLLGATAPQGQALAVAYWRRAYPFLADDYRTGACAPGGPLDEALPSAPWSA
ncbi:MAG: hypothetical protein M3N21_06915 [Actinomycetota bacterium]|nr:hypothetical protein [Actinomycetota bacterium]